MTQAQFLKCKIIKSKKNSPGVRLSKLELFSKKTYTFSIFYPEINFANTVEITLPFILNFKSFSQFCDSNTLFICGPSLATSDCYDSTLILISLNDSKVELKPNSKFLHENPVLIKVQKSSLLVLGGSNTTTCEYYDLRNNRWSELPSLPKIIGFATAEELNDFVYVVGGKAKRTEFEGIFKLSLNNPIMWDLIVIKNGSLIGKSNAILIPHLDNSLLLLGGEREEEIFDEIIEIDLDEKKAEKRQNLPKRMIFTGNSKFVMAPKAFILTDQREILKVNGTFETSEIYKLPEF